MLRRYIGMYVCYIRRYIGMHVCYVCRYIGMAIRRSNVSKLSQKRLGHLGHYFWLHYLQVNQKI